MSCSCIGICLPEPDPDKFLIGILAIMGIIVVAMVVLYIAELVIGWLSNRAEENDEWGERDAQYKVWKERRRELRRKRALEEDEERTI